jgi:hypothetical protein
MEFSIKKDPLLEEFVHAVNKDEKIKKRKAKKVLKEIENLWNTKKYSKLDALLLYHSKDKINHLDLKFLTQHFLKAKRPITSSERKSGRAAIYRKYKKSFHNPFFRDYFHDYFDILCSKIALILQESQTKETLYEVIKETDMMTALYLIEKHNAKDNWIKIIKKHFLLQYTAAIIDLYYFSEEELIEKWLSPKKEDRKTKQHENISLKEENRQLKSQLKQFDKKIGNARVERINLLNEMNTLQQVKDNLQNELNQKHDKIFDELKEEKDELETKLKDAEEKLKEDRFFYEEHINAMAKMLGDVRTYNHEEGEEDIKLNLQGRKFAFIGGVKLNYYEEIINEFNGEMIPVSVEDYNKISGAISACDIALFLTDVNSHAVFRCFMKEIRKHNKPFIYLNSRGVSSFRRELLAFLKETHRERVMSS